MNVLSAMAGITDGNFCKKFTKENIDIVTIGGYNSDLETYNAAIENSKNNRKEFLIHPNNLSTEISNQIKIIRDYNPSWKGLVNVNVRGTKPKSFKILKDNQDIDILEINAHCRQKAIESIGAGQALLKNEIMLSKILEEVSTYENYDISVKIRANVEGVDTLKIIELIESYDVKYLHVDATNPGIMEADYDIIKQISNNTTMHLIGNNSVTTRDDYLKMIKSGADSVSVARGSLEKSIDNIFRKKE